MDSKLAVELERLLSELADEGASQQRVERIENLLLDNPELQDHYWSWMDNHIILGTDRAAILGESKAASPLVSAGREGTVQNTNSRSAPPSQKLNRWRLAATLAVSACLLGVLLPGIMSWSHVAVSLWGSDEEETWQIPRITRVSWEGPFFAEHEQNLTVKSGAHVGLVSLGLVNDLPVNGYVLRLEPGTSAELMMAADAHAENNLSVTELSATGTPIRRSVSFNNFGAGGMPGFGNVRVRMRRYGLIGTWSEFNDTDKPKCYLINGIHKSTDPDLSPPHPDQEFQLSKMVVALDEPDLVLLGWDDSGVDANERFAGVEPDGDYDDISVAIRISGKDLNPKPEPASSDYRLIATPPSARKSPQTDGADRYQFTLAPGEIVVLKVSSDAEITNAIFLLHEKSDEVLWSAESPRPGTVNLGAVAIQNTSKQDIEFALVGENSLGDAGSGWQHTDVVAIHTQPGCAILGFEDEEGESGDFDDIRITVLTMSPNHSTPYESR